MTPEIITALGIAIVALVNSIINGFISWSAKKTSEETKIAVDGKMDKFLLIMSEKAEAQATLKEKAAQSAREGVAAIALKKEVSSLMAAGGGNPKDLGTESMPLVTKLIDSNDVPVAVVHSLAGAVVEAKRVLDKAILDLANEGKEKDHKESKPEGTKP